MKKFQFKYPREVEIFMQTFYSRLSEKDKRGYAAAECCKLPRGGQKYICEILGCSPQVIITGMSDLKNNQLTDRIRRVGAGPKRIVDKTSGLNDIFLEIAAIRTAGDPMRDDIVWTDLSAELIVECLQMKGYTVSVYIVNQLLKNNKYVKRTAVKSLEPKVVEDRDAQFKKIEMLVKEYVSEGNPILSMDVKKKEQIGLFFRAGKLFCIEAQRVLDHDFPSEGTGVAIPHGLQDIMRNEAYISIGTSKDTSEFSCDSIENYWNNYGKVNYPHSKKILILADGGGSNSSRHYIFKEDLEALSNKLGIEIRIAHYPPYTSKYNPIEHRVFCHITRSCQGVVFKNIDIVNALVGRSKTNTGLKVFSRIVYKVYATGRKIATDFKENMRIIFDDYLGKWNYTATPATSSFDG